MNAEIKRRTNVVDIFPNGASIVPLVGAMMLEQNDEWSLDQRCMQLEGLQSVGAGVPHLAVPWLVEYRVSQPVSAVDLRHAIATRPGTMLHIWPDHPVRSHEIGELLAQVARWSRGVSLWLGDGRCRASSAVP